MTYKTMRVERPGEGYALLTLARPEVRNAISPQTVEELRDAVDALARDQTLRSVVLRGEGESFCSGGDETVYAERHAGGEAFRMSRDMQRVLDMLWQAPCFTMAALDGDAVGGGLELALACDYRIARPSARLGAIQVTLGLMPAWGGRTRLVRTVGRSRALELMLTGRLVSADEAARYGLVDEIAGDALERAVELAVAIAQHPASCVRAIEELVSAEESSSHSADLEREARRFAELWESPARRALVERLRPTSDRKEEP